MSAIDKSIFVYIIYVYGKICPAGDDDTVREFDLSKLGISDPEGVDLQRLPDGRFRYLIGSTGDGFNLQELIADQDTVIFTSQIDISQLKSFNTAGVGILNNGDIGVVFRGRDNNNPPVAYDRTFGGVRPHYPETDTPVSLARFPDDRAITIYERERKLQNSRSKRNAYK